jgi:hypothetical protein
MGLLDLFRAQAAAFGRKARPAGLQADESGGSGDG